MWAEARFGETDAAHHLGGLHACRDGVSRAASTVAMAMAIVDLAASAWRGVTVGSTVHVPSPSSPSSSSRQLSVRVQRQPSVGQISQTLDFWYGGQVSSLIIRRFTCAADGRRNAPSLPLACTSSRLGALASTTAVSSPAAEHAKAATPSMRHDNTSPLQRIDILRPLSSWQGREVHGLWGCLVGCFA